MQDIKKHAEAAMSKGWSAQPSASTTSRVSPVMRCSNYSLMDVQFSCYPALRTSPALLLRTFLVLRFIRMSNFKCSVIGV